MNRTLLLLCSVMLLCLATTARAANIPAGSCSSSDVQSAINSASTRDTVTVPAGNCTWTSTVTISGKAISIIGAGTSSTNITAGTWPYLNITPTTTNFVSITGFHFNNANHTNDPGIRVNGTPGSGDVGLRFHHNEIINAGSIGMEFDGLAYGLVDHNTFTMGSQIAQMIRVLGETSSTNGALAWDVPLQLGTNQFVYIEDNTFIGNPSCDGVTDSYNGGRSVVRHNILWSCGGGGHGTDTGGHRSMAYTEMYSNQFNYLSGDQEKRVATIRGGTGLFYDNTQGVAGINNGITVQYWRMSSYQNGSWGRCNGTQYKMDSNFQGASTGGTYLFQFTDADSHCTTGGTCTRFFDGPSINLGYPCRDQPGVGPGQVLMPLYAWNNTPALGGIGTYCGGISDCLMDTGIVANRDYFNYVSSGFNGTVGTGRGTLAARPATCTAKVGYWSTTDNTLYQCSSTNTWTVYYRPYTYPHPLQALQAGGGDTTPPVAPKNLVVN